MQPENLIWKPVGKFCGVYKLILNGEVQYIGHAKVVSRRVGEHRWEKRIPFDKAEAVEVPEADLLSVERELIALYTPKFNVNCVGWRLRSDRLCPNSPRN